MFELLSPIKEMWKKNSLQGLSMGSQAPKRTNILKVVKVVQTTHSRN